MRCVTFYDVNIILQKLAEYMSIAEVVRDDETAQGEFYIVNITIKFFN